MSTARDSPTENARPPLGQPHWGKLQGDPTWDQPHVGGLDLGNSAG